MRHPVAINVRVAAIDLIESLGIPQTPCPLVQPLPILVPKPTKKPPMIQPGRLREAKAYELESKNEI